MDKEILKEDVKHILEEAESKLKKWGKKTVKAAKKGEKEIIKMSKIGKLQLDILGISIKKEKFYRDLGKKVVALCTDGKLKHKKLDEHMKKFEIMEREIEDKKSIMSNIAKEVATKQKTTKAK